MQMEIHEGLASKIKVPDGHRDVLVFDSKLPGFFLRKYSSGRCMYGVRYSVNGKQRRLDVWDVVKGNLATARREAADVRAKARLGVDVLAQRQAAIDAASRTRTILQAATDYLETRRVELSRGELRPRYYDEMMRQLVGGKRKNGKDRQPAAWKPLHGRDVASVKRADVQSILDDVSTKRGPREADHAKVALSGMFSWAMGRGLVEANPVVGIKSGGVARRDRTLTVGELREVWQALGATSDDFARIARLLICTGCRRDEVGQLSWSEVAENAAGAQLEIPGGRTKNHLAFVVPLSELALAQLPEKHEGWPFVFGRRAGRGYSGYSKSKRELDAAIVANRKAKGFAEPMPAFCLHDLRRTTATMIRELMFADTHLVELCLNHISGTRSGVAGIYDRSERLEERRAALENWSDWIAANVAK